MFRKKKKPISEYKDEELVIAIPDGNNEAFNEIYKRYHKRLLYYFYRMLGSRQELAEDFMQDVFYKLIDKPYLFNSSKKFSTWVFSVAHNMCKNEYRSREVRKIIVETENPDTYQQEQSKKTHNEELINAVFSELNSFDENHRSAFLLKYREGFTLDEISETLNLPKGTVKSRLFYTRKKLQETLMVKYPDTIESLF